MNDKRDEVKKQIESALDGWSYDDWAIDPLADLILSRETKSRREIADELDTIKTAHPNLCNTEPFNHSIVCLLDTLIEKLRGNK